MNGEIEKTQAGQSVPPVTECHSMAPIHLVIATNLVPDGADSRVVHSGWSRGVEEILLAQPLNPIHKLEFEVAKCDSGN